MAGSTGNGQSGGPAEKTGRSPGRWQGTPFSRLILVPLILCGIWIAEIFFFAGWQGLFLHPEPFGILFYTLMTCIFIGIILPVVFMRQAFFSGDINMLQLGFRPIRRVLLMGVLTVLVVAMAVVLQNPFGANRAGFLMAFLLLLPTGIASAMICYVLAGTHIQAFVRDKGVLVAILSGALASGLLFALTMPALVPSAAGPDAFIRFLSAGIIAALFFFAVRDVWAVSIVVTAGLVWLMAGWLDPAEIARQLSVCAAAALLSAGTLAAIQWYLSWHYVTIPAPAISR